MENRRLYRSQRQRAIAGVCGGLGEYFNMDPVIWRIIFIIISIVGGGGILIYIILWIALPENYEKYQQFTNKNSDKDYSNENNFFSSNPEDSISGNGTLWGGIILILLGSLFLLDRFIPSISFGDLWPVLLIFIGFILIYNAYKDNQHKSDNNN